MLREAGAKLAAAAILEKAAKWRFRLAKLPRSSGDGEYLTGPCGTSGVRPRVPALRRPWLAGGVLPEWLWALADLPRRRCVGESPWEAVQRAAGDALHKLEAGEPAPRDWTLKNDAHM